MKQETEARDGDTPPAPIAPATRDAVFIGAARYRRASYGGNHPLGIPRVSLTADLIRCYGAFTEGEYLESYKARVAELERFHTREYVAVMRRCEALGKVRDRHRKRHNIGNFENPYFTDFFTIPATAAGGSIQGAEEVLAGRIAFNPAGGMHHAMPDRARGFCFFNDPVLGILRLRQEGWRVLYLDLDAHHGDGVECAFRNDPHVLTVSLHMDTEYAYPFEGGRADRGSRAAAQRGQPAAPGGDQRYGVSRGLRDGLAADRRALRAGRGGAAGGDGHAVARPVG